MKRLFTFLVAGCFIASLSAQTMKSHLSVKDNSKQPPTALKFQFTGHENTHHFVPLARYKKTQDNLLKTANNNKQKLDSAFYAYKDSNGDWILSDKDEYQYNASGKVILEVYYNSETKRDTEQWVGSIKVDYSYDLNDMLTERVTSLWDNGNNQWEIWWKSVYSYDASGNLILIISYTWNQGNNQWQENWKQEIEYDENGNVIRETGYDWDVDSNQWVNNFKSEYTYDNNGNPVQILDYEWGDNQWENDYKTDIEYNSDNYLTRVTESSWYENQWVYDYKTEFAYDDQWNMILETVYYWDDENWVNDDKYENTFEDNGNLTTETHYTWNDDSGTWEDQNKSDYTYNNDYAFEDLVLPIVEIYGDDSWWELYYHHMLLTEVYSYPEEDSKQWEEAYKSNLYYSEIEITGIAEDETVGDDIMIYPNPANNEFGVRSLEFGVGGGTIEIYDLNGRKLLEKQIPAGSKEVKVDVNNLQCGMYFCKLSIDGKSVTKKLIIQK